MVAPGRGHRMSGPDLWLTIRGTRLLLRGWESNRAARYVACDLEDSCRADAEWSEPCTPQWSDLGRGYVLPASHMPDALAYAQSHRLLAVVSDLDRTEKSA